ncbi:hypothetical protein VNI00_006186 [Paramarasmius palmivorus]|uniref:Uncharacterized protein n=1 Tax=Paramarasmius palmivorus TaxID=297713 RepID=A0AAW0D5L8_9AGAR
MSPGLAKAMIERSDPALIDIEFYPNMYWSSPENFTNLKEALTNISRIASIRIDLGLLPEIRHTILPILTQPAPNIRTFEFKCDISLPKGLFGDKAPNLEELSLSDCDLPWNTSFLGTRLKSLTWIARIALIRRPSENQFMSVLSGLSSLETLILEKTIPYSIQQKARVSLPRLRYLHLFSDTYGEDCIEFLDHLDIPETASIIVRMICYSDIIGRDIADFRTLFSCLARHTTPQAGRPISKPITALSIDGTPGFHFAQLMLSIWNTDVEMSAIENGVDPAPTSSNLPRFCLRLYWDIRTLGVRALAFDRTIGDALSILHLASLQTFSLCLRMSEDSAVETIFKSMQSTKIERLIIWGGCIGQVLSLLSCRRSTDNTGNRRKGVSGGTQRMHLPALQELSLLSVDFQPYGKRRVVSKQLLEALETRSKQGAPVKRLALKYCKKLLEDDVDRFKSVVEQVEWEGYNDGGDDDDDDNLEPSVSSEDAASSEVESSEAEVDG